MPGWFDIVSTPTLSSSSGPALADIVLEKPRGFSRLSGR